MRTRIDGNGMRRAGAAVLCLAAAGALAQNISVPVSQKIPLPPQAPPVQLKVNPEVAMREWEPPVDAPYILGRGDAIVVDVASRPELNSHQAIGPDGMISFPQAGEVKVDGKTRVEAAEAIQAALSKYYTNISVTVAVDKYASNQLLLLGAVEHPGVQSFDRAPTLLEVITRGGGVVGNVALSAQRSDFTVGGAPRPSIIGVPERCAIYRGTDKVLWIDLKQLLDTGSPLANMRLMRDDIVYVPSPEERYISVMGQVMHPGALRLESGMTLDKVISLSGGITPDAGHYPNIQIISPSTGQTRVISFKQVLAPAPIDLTLHTGDIVYVPKSGFASFGYALQQVSPLVTMFTAAALFEH